MKLNKKIEQARAKPRRVKVEGVGNNSALALRGLDTCFNKRFPENMKKYKIILSAAIMVLMFGCSQQSEPLSIAFWNVENLFDLVDDPQTNDEEFALGGKKKVTREIYDLKMKHCAEVLKDLDAHIVGLCEVENRFVLEELNRAYIERDYSIIHFDSPDERGIDVALLYDPEYFQVTASRAINNP
ncbi:MAG: hypothetical protein V3S22_01800, partial [Candidatus Neomarinimicrobiota bacterium]